MQKHLHAGRVPGGCRRGAGRECPIAPGSSGMQPSRVGRSPPSGTLAARVQTRSLPCLRSVRVLCWLQGNSPCLGRCQLRWDWSRAGRYLRVCRFLVGCKTRFSLLRYRWPRRTRAQRGVCEAAAPLAGMSQITPSGTCRPRWATRSDLWSESVIRAHWGTTGQCKSRGCLLPGTCHPRLGPDSCARRVCSCSIGTVGCFSAATNVLPTVTFTVGGTYANVSPTVHFTVGGTVA